MLTPFPAPTERTPDQKKIAEIVNEALVDAFETFAETLDRKISEDDFEDPDLLSAIETLGDHDFKEFWLEWVNG